MKQKVTGVKRYVEIRSFSMAYCKLYLTKQTLFTSKLSGLY